MKPRLPSSKKWTAFPKEFTQQIEDVFKQNFSKQLKSAELIVEGRIYAQEILIRVGYLEAGRLRQANFEVSVEYSPTQEEAIMRINDGVDAAASMMMDYFEKEQETEGDVDFPLIWKEIPFNNRKLFVQFSTVNSKLEAEADALLGASEEGLVNEDLEDPADEDDDISLASGEDESEDEASEDPSPKMFGGRKKKKTQLH